MKYDYSISNQEAINRLRTIQNCTPIHTRDDVRDIYALELAIEMLTQLVNKETQKPRKEFDLFCTFTMETYLVPAYSELEAREKLAKELGYPLDAIDVWR